MSRWSSGMFRHHIRQQFILLRVTTILQARLVTMFRDICLFLALFYLVSPSLCSPGEGIPGVPLVPRVSCPAFFWAHLNRPLCRTFDRWALFVYLTHPLFVYWSRDSPAWGVFFLLGLSFFLVVAGVAAWVCLCSSRRDGFAKRRREDEVEEATTMGKE